MLVANEGRGTGDGPSGGGKAACWRHLAKLCC